MAGVDYRQLQSPEQVRTDLPDDGSGMRAAALSGLFKEFEGISGGIYKQVQAKRGALAGAAAGATGHPDYREGLGRFTAYSQAFNNAATGAYAIQAEAQADDAAARLRVQANNDPGAFHTTYSAVRDGVLKNAPAEAVPMLTELYNKRLAAGMAAVSGDQATEIRTMQRGSYDEGVARQTSRVAALQGSENPQDQVAAMDEHVKLSALIDGGVNAGLYSKAEGQAMQIGAMRTITAQVFNTQVDRELARPDGDVVKLLENFRQAHLSNLADPKAIATLSEPEFQKLMSDATARISAQNMMVALSKRDNKSAEEARFAAGDVLYTTALLRHGLTERALGSAVQTGDLKPERATALLTQLLQGNAQVKSDPAALLKLKTDPAFLSMTNGDISTTPGISDADRLKLIEERDHRNDTWENSQTTKQALRTIDTALKILPGTPTAALSDEQREASRVAREEYTQLQNATDPAHRETSAALNAQTVVKHAAAREAAADVRSYTTAKDGFIKRHGPGSADAADEKTYQAKLKWYDDKISQSRTAAGGK